MARTVSAAEVRPVQMTDGSRGLLTCDRLVRSEKSTGAALAGPPRRHGGEGRLLGRAL